MTQKFAIVSINHTSPDDEHICFWGRDRRGYTAVFGEYLGLYEAEDAARLNDGVCTMAVPREAIDTMLSPEPYYKLGEHASRWYDQRGPVVRNTKENWMALIAARMPPEIADIAKLKPPYRRKKFRSFSLPEVKP